MFNDNALIQCILENICCWLRYPAPHTSVIPVDAFRSAEESEGIGGLHKQAGKVTPGCKANTSMSSQLPFNTKAMLAMAPSEYRVGVKVCMTADRMYPCEQANTETINKGALNT